jgi:hypothetical protein
MDRRNHARIFAFKARVHTISTLGFLLVALLAGCGGGKKAVVMGPTVQSVTPTAGATAVPVATLITATFSEAMNPTTISTSTFTVAGPAGAPATGTVSISGNTATLTPATLLAGNSMYTATDVWGTQKRLRDSPRRRFEFRTEIFDGVRNYCGNCLTLVTREPVKRTKTVLDGGWP